MGEGGLQAPKAPDKAVVAQPRADHIRPQLGHSGLPPLKRVPNLTPPIPPAPQPRARLGKDGNRRPPQRAPRFHKHNSHLHNRNRPHHRHLPPKKLVPKRPPHLPHHHHRPGATGGGVGKPRKPPPFLRQQGQGNRGPKTPGVGDATPSSTLPGVGSGSQGTVRPKHSSPPVPTQLPPGKEGKENQYIKKMYEV